MPFKKGQSGNRGGRPKGAKNKVTVYREELMEGLPDVIEKLLTGAKRGSRHHIKMVLDRTVPALKSQDAPIKLRLRGSIEARAQTIVNAASEGKITPDEAGKLMGLIADQAKIIETSELARRLETIEQLLEETKK